VLSCKRARCRSPALARLYRLLPRTRRNACSILAEHLIDEARRSAYERVGHFLLELFVRLKSADLTHNMSFELPLTQELIADALDLTTVHVNRTMRALREDGLIAVIGKVVTVLDFDDLSRLSDFENSYLAATARALGSELASSSKDGPRRQATPQLAPSE
jgi:hypothetical protein